MPTTATAAWIDGLRSVVIFRLAALVLLVRSGQGEGWRGVARAVAFAGVSASWTVGPVLVVHLLDLVDGGIAGVAVLAVLSWLMVVVFGGAWAATARHIAWGDNLLSARLQLEVASWLARLFRWQMVGPVIVAGAVGASLWWQPELRAALALDSFIGMYTLAVSVLVFGTVAYFVALLPGIATTVTRAPVDDVLVHDLDPSSTPAMRLVSEIMMVGSLLILLALVAFSTTPLLFGLNPANSPLWSWAPIVVAIMVVALLRVALYPTLQLHWWLLRRKTAKLDHLAARINQLDRELQQPVVFRRAREQRRMELVQEYFLVAGTENSPFRASSIIQFSAAVVGAVLAFILTVTLRVPA